MKQQRAFEWLDYGRFLAALSVVFFHYTALDISNGTLSNLQPIPFVTASAAYGFLGVDFFFLISGFVISISAEGKSASDFAIARFVRLWPTFLLCMTLTTIAIFLLSTDGGKPDVFRYIANLTMVPAHIGFRPMDGAYWTLAFEIIFYILVFLIILLGQIKHFETLTKIWLAGIIVAYFTGHSLLIFSYYFALFAAGGLFSIVMRHGFSTARIIFLIAAYVFSTYVAIEKGTARGIADTFTISPWVIVAIYTVFYLTFLIFSTSRLGDIKLPYSRKIGLMTYPLYLLHSEIGGLVLAGVATEQNKYVVIPVTIGAMILLSLAIVNYWERPLKTFWTNSAKAVIGALPVPKRSL